MNTPVCHLPPDLEADIAAYESDVQRFLSGDLAPALFKARRVPRGIYEQRRDGSFMMRVRLPGGAFTAAQARALAALARPYGSGRLHVTTRQDIQFHDLPIGDTPALMRGLLAAGLTSKGGGGNTVRNVMACPYAGICPHEAFDVTPHALAVTEHLIALAGSYNLPRKFKIAFSGCAADCALAGVNDVGFIAGPRGGRPGFAVYTAGGMGSEPRLGDRQPAWLPAADAVRAAEAGRRLFDRLGDRRNRRRARLRHAVARVGSAAFAEWFRAELEAVAAAGVPDAPEVPVGETPAAAAPACPNLEAALVRRAGLRVLPQRQEGFVAVPLALPLGEIGWADLEALADLAERFSGEQGLRAMPDQKLVLRHVREADLPALRAALGGLSADVVTPRPLDAFVACTGAATCRLGLCLSQPAARACASALAEAGLAEDTLRGVDIRMNGCMNSCGQHPIGTIGLFGVTLRVEGHLAPGYRLLLGARRGEGRTRLGVAVGTVPARALPALLVDLLRDFEAHRTAGEPLSDFYDRMGPDHFKALLERHANLPPYATNPDYYRDWGCDEDFSLAGRGAGECGAGVFEVITDDLNAARKALAAAAAAAPEAHSALWYDATLAAARALLVVRGVDSRQPDEIFRAFETHFLDTGLVSAEFRDLLARARGRLAGWGAAFDGQAEAVSALVERVDQLFGTLDAELKFQLPAAAPASAGAAAAEAVRPADAGPVPYDLSGVACPMNYVKAKLRMESLAAGDVLSLILDDGAPVQNVPASFRADGQEVLDIVRRDDGRWRVDIRKRH